MGSHIIVEPESFQAASSVLGHLVAVEGFHGLWALSDALDSCAGMAGDDPAGTAWAAAYDPAATRTTQVCAELIAACYRLAALLQATGFNYAGAESASTPGITWNATPDITHWADAAVSLPAPCSAAGHGSTIHPDGFSLVEHLLDTAWPNGHQDRLHRAATAWTNAAALFDQIAENILQADTCISLEHSPETPAALSAIHAMRSHLHEIARTQRAMAAACSQYAHHLDQAHHELISELESLLAWTAAIQAGGALLSAFTLGLAEAPTQAAEAERISATAATITTIINRLQAAATAAATMTATAETLTAVQLRLRVLLDSRVAVAPVEIVRAAHIRRTVASADETLIDVIATGSNYRLPGIVASRAQLEKKFLHARDLGVTSPRGKAGFAAFDRALSAFIDSPGTRRIVGTYHRKPRILNVELSSRVVVIQELDGTLESCWHLRPMQLAHVLKTGDLGGG